MEITLTILFVAALLIGLGMATKLICSIISDFWAKRSGVPQGCPSSANGSADARAADETIADSSVVRLTEAIRRGETKENAECEVEIDLKGCHLQFLKFVNPFAKRGKIIIQKTEIIINSKPPALQAQPERASQPNADLSDERRS